MTLAVLVSVVFTRLGYCRFDFASWGLYSLGNSLGDIGDEKELTFRKGSEVSPDKIFFVTVQGAQFILDQPECNSCTVLLAAG